MPVGRAGADGVSTAVIGSAAVDGFSSRLTATDLATTDVSLPTTSSMSEFQAPHDVH